MTGPSLVTVVVSTRNRGAMIEPALRSLMALDHPAFEVVVVDQSTNTSTRDCVLELAGSGDRIRYLPSTHVGLSCGRNAGLAASSAGVVAFTDDDCVADPGWLKAIEHELRDPDVAGVFGRVLPNVEGRRSGIDLAFKDSTVRVEYSGKGIPWYIGHGANMAFRRADLVAVGGFDEVLGAGGKLPSHEDGDISYRLLRAGRKLVFAPDSIVYHRQWRDWGERKRTEFAYGIGAGGQFAKYIRSGDMYGVRLLATWVWQLGVRRVGAGLIKWRSGKVVYLGLTQLTVPWIGIWRSRRFAVDPALLRYR